MINTKKTEKKFKRNFQNILELIGEDPSREGLVKTPERIYKAYLEWLRGYEEPDFETSVFKSDYSGILIRKNIPFQSFCEHHLALYKGYIDFAYIPNGYVIGISKIPRFLKHYSAKLTIQENLTEDLLRRFYSIFQNHENAQTPKGTMIIIKAWHSCESSRGIKVDAPTITSSVRGIFERDASAKNEVLELLKRDNDKR